MCFIHTAFAQKKAITKNSRTTLVKIYTSLNGLSDSSRITAEDAEKMIALPLTIQDTKKTQYTISSYQFMYVKKGVTEDEVSGKVTPVMSSVSNIFKSSPLSPIWIKSIQEQVKPGEELFFFDIIVKTSTGKLLYAPTLRLLVR